MRPADESPPAIATRPARSRTRRWPASSPPSSTSQTLGERREPKERLDSAFTRITSYEESLSAHALTRLTSTPGVRLYGIADPARVAERTPTFAFTIAGATPRDIAAELGREGIFVWDGNYYALGAMLALGLEEHGGAVRAGFLHYTTLDEVDRLCDLVAAIAARG